MTGALEAADRERMIRQLLARRGLATERASAGIPRRAPGTRIPLSPLQEGMWFIDRLDPGSPVYVLATALRLIGPLDLPALQSALDTVVARHEALRTGFAAPDGQPEQVVLAADDPAARVAIAVDDLTGLPTGQREARGQAALHAEVETGFDLSRAPLLRVKLFRLAAQEHLLGLSLHHIISDERSLALIVSELLTAYQGLVGAGPDGAGPGSAGDVGAGPGSGPAEPAVQFPDYVLWQRSVVAGRAERQREFWARQLAGSSGLLALPTDRPRPAQQTFPGTTRGFLLSAELTSAMDGVARRTGCTRFMITLAATQLVLHSWTGQDDICVGSPISTRTGDQLHKVVGLLVNSVAFRTDLGGDPTVAELLGRVRQTCLDALSHADLPLEQVVEVARPPRDPSRNPLFQVMCVVNPAGSGQHLSALRIEPVPVTRETSRMDLTVMLYETSPALSGVVDYNTDLFDAGTIERFIDRFRLALAALTGAPHRRLSELDLLGRPERQLLAGWQGGERSYPRIDGGLAALIAARAAEQPDAIAIHDEQGTLSYGELIGRARRLAGRLRSVGVGPEVRVGLALPAGAAALVGLLGILTAGGAYLPLDPAHPGPRLLGLLADAGTPVTITAAAHADRFTDYPGTVLLLDGAGAAVATGGAGESPDDCWTDPFPGGFPASHPDQLAYVIYTSGSTGSPKGVMVNHRTAANLAHAFIERHGIGPDDRLLMLPPLSFDASVGDLLPALVSGAALVVHPRPAELTGPELLALCARQRITMVDTAVALWIRWVADLAGQPPVRRTPLRVLMVGGEAAPTATTREWARLTGGQMRVHHHYGPTEGTVCATDYSTVDGSELPGLARLPIGHPLPNLRVHLLDSAFRPVPIGATGEVHLGGLAPARGYLGAPGLTAQRFVPDPFGGTGGRLYRTGDLARHRPDGALEFLGRTDRQVKIRGHRIEVGEVEAACASQPGVARAAVTVRDDGTGARLVGFLVPTDAANPPEPARLRAALRQLLPDYLVPAALMIISELPLNAHGKLDEAALPAPAEQARTEYLPPSTDTERALAGIWAEMLRVDRVGARDNFFDLGGHSLLAGPLAARITTALGVTLPLRALFDTADLTGLAGVIDDLRVGSTRPGHGRPGEPSTVGPAADQLSITVRADAELPDDICAHLPAQPPSAHPEQVLITGATGFLGAHLVADWLAATDARLHCLVRAGSPGAAVDRVRANLARYGLWQERFATRLTGVPGDLAEPALGLGQRDFDALAANMDAIVHNGGVVNFLLPYDKLRAANVCGTLEVLRMAGRERPSAVHFVSTLGVFLTPDRTGTTVREADHAADCTGLGDGYNSSKWAADTLVRAARSRGLAVTIHRPARITGQAATGVGNADDYFSRLLKTFVQLGAVPALHEDDADLSPVDHVAAGIGRLGRQAGLWGRDFHYYNNRTISFPELATALADFGYPVRLLPYSDWRAALLDRPDAALAPFAPLFGEQPPRRTQPDFDCTVTETALARAGLVCPPADAALIHTYLAWYVRTGFLDPPAAPGNPATAMAPGRANDCEGIR